MKTGMKQRFAALAAMSVAGMVFAQGSLTPPGAPGETMKTLDQVEARTPIPVSSSNHDITQSGSYYLTGNITVSDTSGIRIYADDVTLDLNGFTIKSTDATPSSTGIFLNGFRRNVTILNGFIKGEGTIVDGAYAGSGFSFGIYSSSGVNIRIYGVSVSDCLNNGIDLPKEDSTIVESCEVRTVGGDGITASIIRSSAAVDCAGTAIQGDQVSDCRGETLGGGYGLSATIANNCYGYNSSGTYGLYAYTAINCYGYNNSGTYGLYAVTANNCHGYNASGSSGSYGLYASNIAIGSRGYSNGGTGLQSYIANSCFGSSSSGTATQIPYKYNMP